MRPPSRATLPFIGLTFAAQPLVGQLADAGARPLRTVARSTVHFRSVTGVRPLTDGRVIVNDAGAGKIYLIDSSLSNSIVVKDYWGGTSAPRSQFGGAVGSPGSPTRLTFRDSTSFVEGTTNGFAAIVPYRGDSTLLVDGAAGQFHLIDGAGKVGPAFAAPKEFFARIGASIVGGTFDGVSGILYTVYSPPPRLPRPQPAHGDSVASGCQRGPQPDSMHLVRSNLVTHDLDTLARVAYPKMRDEAFLRDKNGYWLCMTVMSPIQPRDRWVVLSTGTLAIVRGEPLRVDLVDPNGRSSSADLRPLAPSITPSQKASLVDSLRAWFAANPLVAGRVPGFAPMIRTTQVVAPTDIRDAGVANAVFADADGTMWIQWSPQLSTPPSMGEVRASAGSLTDASRVYDIVNRRGAVVERIIVPGNHTIVAFRPGVIYLTSQTPDGVRLVTATAR